MKKLSAVLFLGMNLGIGWVSIAQEPSVPKANAEAPVEPPKQEKSEGATAVTASPVPCPCPTAPSSDQIDVLKVTEVWIQNTSKPTMNKSLEMAGDKSNSTEIDKLNDELRKITDELNRCRDARKCREERATEEVTIRLENMGPRDGSKPFLWKLSGFDLVGSDSIEIIDANHGLVVNWEPINPNCKKATPDDSNKPDSPKTQDQKALSGGRQPQQGAGEQGAGEQGNGEQGAVEPLGNPLVTLTDSGLKTIFQEGGVVAMAASQLYEPKSSIAVQSQGIKSRSIDTAATGLSPSKPFLTGDVEWLTYRQPSLPWTISYELDGDMLLQWVEFGNLSEYTWECGTCIHFLDSESPANSINFKLRQEVEVGKSAIQLLSVRRITTRTWTYDLTQTTPNHSQTLTLENVDNMKDGPVRGKLHGAWYNGNLVLGDKNTATAKLDSFPVPRIEVMEKPKGGIFKLTGLKLGKFEVSKKISREISIGDFDPSTVQQKIVVKISPTDDLDLPKDSPWAFQPKGNYCFLEAPLMAQQISIPPLAEISSQANPLERDFYQDAERKQLLTILKAAMEQGDTSEFVEVLNDVVVLDKAIQANLSKMEELKNSIGELEKQYENTDRPSRLRLIHREIEKLKEQERCLTRAIFSENAQKEADIAKLLREVP